MAQKPLWFKFYPDRFAGDEDVELMSHEAIGAYILLLCKAWNSTPVGTLPNDDRKLAKLARMTQDQWAEVREEVMEAWVEDGDRVYQKRMVEEFSKIEDVSRKRSRAASIRHNSLSEREKSCKSTARAEHVQCKKDASAEDVQCKRGTQSPTFASIRASTSISPSPSTSLSPSDSDSCSSSGSEVGGVGGGSDEPDGGFALSSDPEVQASSATREYPQAFEEFYAPYPRKAKKADAHRAWAAQPAHRRPHLAERSQAYRDALGDELRAGAPAAGPWIRDGRYDDEPSEWRRMAARTLDLPDPDRPAMGRKTTTTVNSGNSWAERKANG